MQSELFDWLGCFVPRNLIGQSGLPLCTSNINHVMTHTNKTMSKASCIVIGLLNCSKTFHWSNIFVPHLWLV
jgi:hypothetical protein